MFYILMAVIGELGFMSLGILSKRLRNRGVQTLSILGVYGFLAPLAMLTAAWFIYKGQADLGIQYALIVAAWLAVCFALNFGNTWLTRFQSLSDGSGYRFGFTVFWALVADLLFFQHQFSPEKVVALILLFSGGTALHFARQKTVEATLQIPLIKRLSIVMFLSLVEAATYFLFKLGTTMQSSDLFHNALSQMLLFSIFLVMGWRSYQSDRGAQHLPLPYVVALMVLMLVAAVADGFAIAGLSLTLFVMFSLIRMSAFAVHDMKTGEIPLSLQTILAIGLIACGFCIVAVTGQG